VWEDAALTARGRIARLLASSPISGVSELNEPVNPVVARPSDDAANPGWKQYALLANKALKKIPQCYNAFDRAATNEARAEITGFVIVLEELRVKLNIPFE
jgi:hypothetical protein